MNFSPYFCYFMLFSSRYCRQHFVLTQSATAETLWHWMWWKDDHERWMGKNLEGRSRGLFE